MSSKFIIEKASKKKTKLRMALTGVGGAGKTVSALRLAQGLAEKVLMIDTEDSSSEFYVGRYNIKTFDIIRMKPPFYPSVFVDAITYAEEQNYDVIIIDSFSSPWAGSGGVLEIVDDVTKTSKSKNSFQAWNVGNKEQERLVQKILRSSAHIIACMRSKIGYESSENAAGKKVPVKIGLKPVQRDSVDYEFQVVFDIARENHYAIVSKDRTDLYNNDIPFLITQETGKKLIEWLNKGEQQTAINTDDFKYFMENIDRCGSLEELRSVYKESLDMGFDIEQNKKIIAKCGEKKKIIGSIDEQDISM